MNQTLPAVSVIIPLYNAEKFIAECLESILSQTFKNFEVIVVDDCSTDDSVAVAENYLPKFNGRLKLSHMEKNSGSGAMPRNKGMILSRGKYIYFVDADDLLMPTALEELYILAEQFNSDVTYCEKLYEVDENLTNITTRNMQNGTPIAEPTLETDDLAKRIHEILKINFAPETVLKFVRRDLLIDNEIFFPDIKPSEDGIWTYGLIFFAKRILRVPNAVYVCRLAENSVMRTKRSHKEIINFCLTPAILGIKTLNKFMERLDFFQKNPQYRYAMLEHVVHLSLSDLFKSSLQLPPSVIYESIKNEYGKNLGEWDILIPFLLADLIEQQKIFVENQKRIAELEQKIK